ncbi:MAG TPA: thioredoxin-dependent thiol peroxidase [Patescibacteria group bacterium]|nr:thioredoxin-dependent thiol peroxidase [Patescibacteria group bacterium]
MALAVGTPAPNFIAHGEDNEPPVVLENYRGKWVVLYFYPKDDTSGCTAEACDFRDNMERIQAKNTVVIGVSPDNKESHKKFKDKYNLNFLLVSDNDTTICTNYDVWKEKNMYGRKFMGVERTTYLIDTEGTIRHVFPKVKVNGHVEEVLKTLNELQLA